MPEEDRHFRQSDDVAMATFRTRVEGALDVLAQGQKLSHDCIDRVQTSFIEYKQGIGQRIENHQDRLARIETSLGIMIKVAWMIVGCTILTLGAAFYKLVIK